MCIYSVNNALIPLQFMFVQKIAIARYISHTIYTWSVSALISLRDILWIYTQQYTCGFLDTLLYLSIAGVWSCPSTTGERPPPSLAFTFTAVDDRRAVMFGGFNKQQGCMNDVYIIDLSTMVLHYLLHCSQCMILLASVNDAKIHFVFPQSYKYCSCSIAQWLIRCLVIPG